MPISRLWIRLSPAALLALALFGTIDLAVGVAARPASDPVELVVLHVNDLHGYAVPREFLGEQLPPEHLGREVGSLFSAASVVHGWREKLFAEDPALEAEHARSGDDGILFLDGGDTWSGALDDFLTEGGNAVALEGSPFLDVDAAVVGNHSWDFGAKRWEALAAAITAHHPLIAANLAYADGRPIPFVRAYTMHVVRGVRIAVIGLIAEGALHSAAAEHVTDFKVADPIARLKAALDEVRDLPAGQRPDLVFVLSHVAFERGKPALTEALAALDDEAAGDDRAARYNVDLVIDAHSHADHTLNVDSNTWLAQADHYGVKLGEIVLSYDRARRALAGPPRIRRVPLATSVTPVHAPMLEAHRELVAKARAANDAPIARAVPELRVPTLLRTDKRTLANPSGDLFTRALLETGRAKFGPSVQVALVNQTGVRAGLYASRTGAITAGSVHAVSPFANKLSVVKVTRASLRAIVEKGVQHVSKLSWAGLEVEAKQAGTGPGAETHRTVTALKLVGPAGAQPLDADADAPVTVICPSFLAGRELKSHTIPGSRVDLDLTDREALRAYLEALAKAGPIAPATIAAAVGAPARLTIE